MSGAGRIAPVTLWGEIVIPESQLKTAKILLADNDLVNVLALKNILHAHGYRNISNAKPAGSERLVDLHNPPSLVVLNVDNTNGAQLQVLKNLQQDLARRDIPVLLLTRDTGSELVRNALELGVKDIISWPFNENEVVARIGVLLENHYLSKMISAGRAGQTTAPPGHQLQVIELTRQIEQIKKSQQQGMQLAGYDSLTGLANTASMCDYLRSTLRNIQEEDRLVAMLLFSLENFSEITKSVGYACGDQILQMAANRISENVERLQNAKNSPEKFFSAKYSGGKFVVVINDLESETKAISIAHRILASMSAPFELPNIVLEIGTQVGVSLAPRFTCEATELVRQSEVALHTAKLSSQPLIVYEKAIDNYDPRRLALMADLRKAINNDALYLVYQPKIDIKNGVVSGVEALLRWYHPDLGLIPPAEFIPLAEQSSVIKPLTVWVLNNAMRQAAAFARSGLDISIAVNISASSLRDDSLVGYTKMLLQKNHVAPERLILEITESAMMHDPNKGLNLLNQLSDIGVQISIDDYGTGYSSLAYLKRLPVKEMKIDRTFIKDMAVDEDDKLIVGTTIDMGHNFGLRVVAEGVEDGQTAKLLREMGCDQLQGYYYAKPMPVGELYEWMTIDNKVAWTLR
ncbi:MAG TPA: EAL domain-containing protein [Gammaproteobacteria bacterium]